MSVTNGNKIVARNAIEAFGGKPSVIKYWDEKKESSIDILQSIDRPNSGVTAYSTIGLNEYSIGSISEDVPLVVEIVGACATKIDLFPNILASCAFNIINAKYKCYPGAIFENVVEFYIPGNSMKHILFSTPFLWEDRLKTIQLPDKKVAWLLAIPISEEEFKYAKENGTEALEEIFDVNQIDIFDVKRKSVK